MIMSNKLRKKFKKFRKKTGTDRRYTYEKQAD